MHKTKSSFFAAIREKQKYRIDKIYNQYYNYVYGTGSTKYRKSKASMQKNRANIKGYNEMESVSHQ